MRQFRGFLVDSSARAVTYIRRKQSIKRSIEESLMMNTFLAGLEPIDEPFILQHEETVVQ